MNRDRQKLLDAETVPSLLVFSSGTLALIGLAILKILPNDALSSIAGDAVSLFGDGTVSNMDDVIASIHRTIPLLAILAVVAIAIGALGLLLRSMRCRTGCKAPGTTPGSLPEPLAHDALRASVHVLVFSLLAIPCLGHGFSGDEAWTLKYVHGSWLQILAPSAANNHIFSTFLIKLSVSLFQESELIVRLPAYFAACLTIMGFYRLTRASWHNTLIAHLTTLQLSTSFGIVFCGTNARGYATVMACTTGFALLRLRVAGGADKKEYLAFLLLTIGATLTLPTGGLIAACFLASVVIPAIIRKENMREALRFLNTFVAGGLTLLCLYAWSFPVRVMYIASRVSASHDGNLDRAFYFFSFWSGPAGTRSGGIVIAVLVMAGLIRLAFRQSPLALFSLLAIIGSLAVHLNSGYPSFWYSAFGLVLVPFVLGEVWSRLIQALTTTTRGAVLKMGIGAVSVTAVTLAAMSAVTSSRMWSVKTYSVELAQLAATIQQEEDARIALVDPGNNTTYYFRKLGVKADVFSRFGEIPGAPDSDYDIVVETSAVPGSSLVQQQKEAGDTEIPAIPQFGRRACRFEGWIDSYLVLYRARWTDRFRCSEGRRRQVQPAAS